MEPNYNPASKTNLPGIIDQVLKTFSLKLENCIPAVVLSHNRNKNTVVVRPAINSVLTDGTPQERNSIELPVHILGSNGVIISAPLQPGDTGWIIAADRDTTLFLQSLKTSNPNTYRTHQFSFGFFIPDKISGFTVQNGNENAFLIQTLDGTTRITLESGKIEIISTTDVKVQCDKLDAKATTSATLETDKLDAKATTSATLETETLTLKATNVIIEGTIQHTGDMTISGTITAATDVLGGGISLKTHTHTSAAPGVPTSPPN